jgi:hypothetical protein
MSSRYTPSPQRTHQNNPYYEALAPEEESRPALGGHFGSTLELVEDMFYLLLPELPPVEGATILQQPPPASSSVRQFPMPPHAADASIPHARVPLVQFPVSVRAPPSDARMVLDSELPQVIPPPLISRRDEVSGDGGAPDEEISEGGSQKKVVIQMPDGRERILVRLFVGQVPTGLRRQVVRILRQLIGIQLFGPNCKGRLKNASFFFAFAEDVPKVLSYDRRISCCRIGSENVPTPLRHTQLVPYEVTLYVNPQPIHEKSEPNATRAMTIELTND